MATILDKIIDNKKREVEAEMRLGDVDTLAAKAATLSPAPSMSAALRQSDTGIIAEFKRRSPSKGDIHPSAMVRDIVPAYESAGASACSVLTDTPFFGGALTDLAVAASLARIPLLRKDFIVSEFQIAQARVYGASAILLIASALSADEISRFTATAHGLGLEVLLELHSMQELDKVNTDADMIGVNNRNLATFETDPALSLKVARELPSDMVKVAESGLTDMTEVRRLRNVGYRGFLIGERFMKHDNPGEALRQFLHGDV